MLLLTPAGGETESALKGIEEPVIYHHLVAPALKLLLHHSSWGWSLG